MKRRIDYTINVRVYLDEEVDPTPLLEITKRNPDADRKVENCVAIGAWEFIKATVTEVE